LDANRLKRVAAQELSPDLSTNSGDKRGTIAWNPLRLQGPVGIGDSVAACGRHQPHDPGAKAARVIAPPKGRQHRTVDDRLGIGVADEGFRPRVELDADAPYPAAFA
jgi:hypothetical protein